MIDLSRRLAIATPIDRVRDLHGEVMDPATGDVWQSLEPITQAEYEALPLEPGWRRIGIGSGVMDDAWFARSPGAHVDGAMERLEIGGRMFGLCARPGGRSSRPEGPEGPVLLLVDKHHLLRFARGREIPVLEGPTGDRFVHVIEGKAALVVPGGWRLASVRLEEDWLLALPNPTTAYFFANGDGFQGPVELPWGEIERLPT